MLAALLKMTRIKNIVIAVITLVVGYALLKNGPSMLSLVLQSLGFAFAIGFANIQNDILDLESDKMNRPERPLVTGKVSVKAARRAWIAMFALMLLCGGGDSLISYFGRLVYGHLPSVPMQIVCYTSPLWFFALLGALLIAYNKKLKHIPLLKNMTVAFLCTTPLLYAALNYYVFNGYVWPESALLGLMGVVPAIPFAFLLTTAREIYKDLEDETGDLKAGIMTFPLIAGSATARKLAGAIIVFTWISLPIPVFYMDKVFGFNYPPLFLIITGITLTPCFAYVLVQAHRQKYRKAQSAVKIGMFLGLIALIVSC